MKLIPPCLQFKNKQIETLSQGKRRNWFSADFVVIRKKWAYCVKLTTSGWLNVNKAFVCKVMLAFEMKQISPGPFLGEDFGCGKKNKQETKRA